VLSEAKTANRQWISSAGPIQTKRVDKALGALRWRGKSHIELNGVVGGPESQSELTAFCAEVSPECAAALDAIGEKHDYTITRENCAAIIADLESATKELQLPVIDNRRKLDEESARLAEQAERDRQRQEQDKLINDSRSAVLANRPEWADGIILAECDEKRFRHDVGLSRPPFIPDRGHWLAKRQAGGFPPASRGRWTVCGNRAPRDGLRRLAFDRY